MWGNAAALDAHGYVVPIGGAYTDRALAHVQGGGGRQDCSTVMSHACCLSYPHNQVETVGGGRLAGTGTGNWNATCSTTTVTGGACSTASRDQVENVGGSCWMCGRWREERFEWTPTLSGAGRYEDICLHLEVGRSADVWRTESLAELLET